MTDSPLERARDAGRGAVHELRRTLAAGLADLLRKDPERLQSAVEMGLVRREWLDDPGAGEPISTATTIEVVQRYLERSVEQRPSLLPSLGLTAIQVLSASAEDSDSLDSGGLPTRLAVAFTDLEGFTRFTDRKGDDAASRLLADHNRAVGPVVRSRGGRVVKRMGDGLLLTFPEPEAAVLACLELTEVAAAPLRLRAGVHLGEVVLTRDDVVGHVVNVAARVAEAAKGNQVLVTDAVLDAVGELRGATFSKPRRRNFKGITEPVRVALALPGGAPTTE
jgi:adenylate cyclase